LCHETVLHRKRIGPYDRSNTPPYQVLVGLFSRPYCDGPERRIDRDHYPAVLLEQRRESHAIASVRRARVRAFRH
jgi:hypothetical protein